jgi:ubiquinone/menaquinone biosynthesis C-methylase UbiE
MNVAAKLGIPDLKHRRREPEMMDAQDVDPLILRRSLAFIRRVNVLFGYTRATLSHLEAFSHRWKPGQRINILDVATGSADVPLAILKWAAKRKHDVHVVGVDLHELTARAAAEGRMPGLNIVRGDALRLPFADVSFDYVITSMFLHHLSDEQAASVLREMNRVARRGILAADLLRDRCAYAWISLFTLFANPMVRHDARVSVAQAYSQDEVLHLRSRAGVDYADYHDHFGYRFVLAGEKRSNQMRSP